MRKLFVEMKTLKGKVTCDAENSSIDPKAFIEIEIRDFSQMDSPPKLIASTRLTNKTSFPVEFTIDYDDETTIVGQPAHLFILRVDIRLGSELVYYTNARFHILDDHSLQPQEQIEMVVVPCRKFQSN